MAARTLLQQAVPTTFGLKAAGWLVGVLDARSRLGRLTLPAQLGGAAGTLAVFGTSGDGGRAALRRGARSRRARAAVARASRARCRACGRARLPSHRRRRRSGSTSCCSRRRRSAKSRRRLEAASLDDAAQAESCTRGARARVRARRARAGAVLTDGEHEHERAAGAWHAEWNALSEALALAGGSRCGDPRLSRRPRGACGPHAREHERRPVRRARLRSSSAAFSRPAATRTTSARRASSSTVRSSATGRRSEARVRPRRRRRRARAGALRRPRHDDRDVGRAGARVRARTIACSASTIPATDARPSRTDGSPSTTSRARLLGLLDELGDRARLVLRPLARRHGRAMARSERARADRAPRARVHRRLAR